VDEFGPLNLQPRPGRQWAAVSGKGTDPGRMPRRRMRATYTRTAGVRHLLAAYELSEDKLFGHVKPRKTRGRFLEFCRYLRSVGGRRHIRRHRQADLTLSEWFNQIWPSWDIEVTTRANYSAPIRRFILPAFGPARSSRSSGKRLTARSES